MRLAPHPQVYRVLGALVALASVALPAAAARAAGGGGAGVSPSPSSGQSGTSGGPSGGAPIGGLAPTQKPTHKAPAPPSKHDHGTWLRGVTITEYWPAPESWFVGRPVSTPGLPGKHRIDWLYSATGVSMEGEGLGLDGRIYHIDALGNGGWVTASGAVTRPGTAGRAARRTGARVGTGATAPGRSHSHWSKVAGRRVPDASTCRCAVSRSLPVHRCRCTTTSRSPSIRRVIPLGSRVYIPAYKRDGYGGWFVAQDTGGAIFGDHVDVYRNPPASPRQAGQFLTGQRAYVIKPHR